MPSTITCAVHGAQQQTFVCQHIAQGFLDRKRVGFFWAAGDPENPRPDAWCHSCNARVNAAGGEWVGEALDSLQPKIMCSSCYDAAKVFHMGGNPWS